MSTETCVGTKLGSCMERAEWDVVSDYVNLDNCGSADYVSVCDDHLAENVRWVLQWHWSTSVTVEPIGEAPEREAADSGLSASDPMQGGARTVDAVANHRSAPPAPDTRLVES